MAGGWDSRPSWRMLDHPAAELCHFPSSPSPESLAQLKRLLVVPWGFCMSCSIVKPCLTLRHHKRQHVRLLCSLLSPGICSNSCPLHLWCQPTDSSSVTFFSCPQSYPESGSFSTSRLFISGGQSIGASALASVPPVNIQGWFFFFCRKNKFNFYVSASVIQERVKRRSMESGKTKLGNQTLFKTWLCYFYQLCCCCC